TGKNRRLVSRCDGIRTSQPRRSQYSGFAGLGDDARQSEQLHQASRRISSVLRFGSRGAGRRVLRTKRARRISTGCQPNQRREGTVDSCCAVRRRPCACSHRQPQNECFVLEAADKVWRSERRACAVEYIVQSVWRTCRVNASRSRARVLLFWNRLSGNWELSDQEVKNNRL